MRTKEGLILPSERNLRSDFLQRRGGTGVESGEGLRPSGLSSRDGLARYARQVDTAMHSARVPHVRAAQLANV